MDPAPGSTGLTPRWRTERFSELDSTQDELKRRLALGSPVHGLVLRADVQTAGRGRRGGVWRSEPGGCYQSVAVRWPSPVVEATGLTLWVGVCLAEELVARGVDCRVKWPNDLYYQDRKLGGVLVESVKGHLLIGVGVNVLNPPPPGGEALGGFTVDEVAGLALKGVERALVAQADSGGEHGVLWQRYEPFDWLAGRRVRLGVGTAREEVEGVAAGIDEAGALLVTVDGDGVRTVHSGTVLAVED